MPFVLIPKGWCRKQLLGSARRFFQIGSMGYIQQKQSRYDGVGKLLKPTKKCLKSNTREVSGTQTYQQHPRRWETMPTSWRNSGSMLTNTIKLISSKQHKNDSSHTTVRSTLPTMQLVAQSQSQSAARSSGSSGSTTGSGTSSNTSPS